MASADPAAKQRAHFTDATGHGTAVTMPRSPLMFFQVMQMIAAVSQCPALVPSIKNKPLAFSFRQMFDVFLDAVMKTTLPVTEHQQQSWNFIVMPLYTNTRREGPRDQTGGLTRQLKTGHSTPSFPDVCFLHPFSWDVTCFQRLLNAMVGIVPYHRFTVPRHA
ncbi:uncharacterized protein [Dermacentor andersoni]|uniref:uncharacterized protein isoform X2 n=1 Tax=Dermacentor andersoni TaxID=34620 RepID=UPI002417ED5C|nr:uncharacterized protein LOC129380595 isoform X3 [Dermacentor andersoni]XP_054918048.1 uncharacterized protein LOC129380595 isoform X3 [Dermacentor andersoni]